MHNDHPLTLHLIILLKHSTGPPAGPSNLIHIKCYNTLTTATIQWESGETNVSFPCMYTVFSTSAETPLSGITQTSYTLRNLKVETDYVVSVSAINECGIESPPSEKIIVRIDTRYNAIQL